MTMIHLNSESTPDLAEARARPRPGIRTVAVCRRVVS